MVPADKAPTERYRFLAGAGPTADAIARLDWSATSLGDIAQWPVSLKTAAAMVVRSPVAMVLLWGADGTMLYNDAYAVIAGDRHPACLGSKVRESWPEIADFNGHVVDTVLRGESLTYRDQELTLQRNGHPEQTWFTLDYSPVPGDGGAPAGVIAVVMETTQRVQAEGLLKAERERHQTAESRSRQILDSAVDYAIMAFDLTGNVTQWNEGAHRILGWTEQEMLGQPLECIFTPEDRERHSESREMTMALLQGAGNDERWHMRKSGERFWASGEMTPIRNDDGQATGFVKVLRDRTEQHRAAEELRQSEERLRRAQHAGGVGTFTLDLASNILSGTREFYRIFGLDESSGGFPATALETLVIPEDARVRSEAATRDTQAALLDVEYRIRRASDGALRWISRRAEYERDTSGKAIRMLGAVQDVTERREAQRALEESASQFRTFAQAQPNQVWTAPASGLLDWFNDRVYEYSGAQPGELDGQAWAQIVHPEDIPVAGALWADSVSSGKNYETEFRVRRADGAYRWHLVRALPLRGADGAINRWVGTNTDIHERKLLEAENMRDRNRIWSLSQELMMVSDFDGRVLAVNPAATRMLGWLEEEMVNRAFADFLHPDDVEKSGAEVHKLSQGSTTLAFENRYRAKDGSYRLLNWTAVPDGTRIHAVARDVTRERMAEDALRQAQKMEAVGQLTGGIAHDFNNLLQGITGSLNVVQKFVAAKRVDEIDRFITSAVNSAKRAAALTHRLLAFSRRQPLDPRAVQVNPLIASMEDLLRRTLGERVRLQLSLSDGLWLTKCDPNQLENAILNLAINSRDAMPDGGTLVIETTNTSLDLLFASGQEHVRPGRYVCVSVTDTGTGMAPDTMSRAFEPFFTTKPMGQGTGLGLSMIYGFARQSDGYARIYSEVGRGTTFKLYLPQEIEAGQTEESAAQAQEAPAANAVETVVVVEDEPVVRALVVQILAELGYKVMEAADGPSGLELLRSNLEVDLLVTDVGLPGLNGRQLADAGRVLRPDLKVLFMTGYAENAVFASGILNPGMAMITKPFAMDALAAKVREIIEGR